MTLKYEVADGELELTQVVRRLTGETENRVTVMTTNILLSPLTDEEKVQIMEDPAKITRPAVSGVVATYVDSKQQGTKTSEWTAGCKKAGEDKDVDPKSACGWTEVSPAEATMFGEVKHTAKRPLDVADFELKTGSYDVFCMYVIQHLESYEPEREAPITKRELGQIELMDGSGAFQALAAGATALIAALAF